MARFAPRYDNVDIPCATFKQCIRYARSQRAIRYHDRNDARSRRLRDRDQRPCLLYVPIPRCLCPYRRFGRSFSITAT